MTLFPADARAMLFQKIPQLGFARTATAFDADGLGIVDGTAFYNSEAGPGDFRDGIIFLPYAAAEHQIRPAFDVVGASLRQSGQAWPAGLDTRYEVFYKLDPYLLNRGLEVGLQEIWREQFYPLSPWLDPDFSSSSLLTPHSWTANASNTTPTKESTAAAMTQGGQTGARNLRLTNTGANGRVDTSEFYCEPDDTLFHGIVGRANNAGSTAFYQLLDAVTGEVLYETSFQSRAFQRVAAETRIPTGCRVVKARFGGIEADAVTDWDTTFGHLMGEESRNIMGPSFLSEQFRFIGFGPCEYGRATGTNRNNATSRQFWHWDRNSDAALYILGDTATPYTLQINRREGLDARDFWFHVKRPYSDFETFATASASTEAPEELALPSWSFQAYSMLHNEDKDDSGMSQWLQLRNEARLWLNAQKTVREESYVSREGEVFIPGGRRGVHSVGQW